MAREPQVTRTIIFTKFKVVLYNKSTQQTEYDEKIVQHRFPSKAQILKWYTKMYPSKGYYLLDIVDLTEIPQLYAMSEEKFVQYATQINQRTSKLPQD